jgi:hypothetical protein
VSTLLALAGKALLDRRKFSRILAFLGRRAAAFLDIGCGDLKYLELMRAVGISPDRLYGLELDERRRRTGASVDERGHRVGCWLFPVRPSPGPEPSRRQRAPDAFHLNGIGLSPGLPLSGAAWPTCAKPDKSGTKAFASII